MTRATVSTSKVKGQGHRLTNADTQMCHIFRTVRPKNFKVGVRMEDVGRTSGKRHDLQG